MSPRPARVAPLSSLCVIVLLASLSGCAEPPRKEMDQAQGAIDAARAAGADEYASTELAAATASLARAEQAASERDYRQALSQALDARERAQTAAREAADSKAEARSVAERELQALATAVTAAAARRDALAAGTAPANALTVAIDAAEQSLQEARTAVEAQRFHEASGTLHGASERLASEMAASSPVPSLAPPAGPGRRPR